MKKLAVLGSTGSIGRQTLEVVAGSGGSFSIVALTARDNYQLLKKQIYRFKPRMVALLNREKADMLRKEVRDTGVEVLEGEEGIIRCATESGCSIVVNGMVGISGLLPTLKAVEAGKDIALANKETLVAGGHLVMEKARKRNVSIIPVDSEHSAIFQCLGHTSVSRVRKVILTASGGPFRGKKAEELKEVTLEDALRHPNWKMGNKITVDSATMMNKGLEVIEAKWLFGLDADRIEVVVHPQSIIHSMVEFVDGAVMAQLGCPDMRIPIQYALTYPDRMESNYPSYNPVELGSLEFFPPDTETFRCLELAYWAMEAGGTMPVVLNGANEVAVDMFINGVISFIEIPGVVQRVMEKHDGIQNPGIDDIICWDGWSREQAVGIIRRGGGRI